MKPLELIINTSPYSVSETVARLEKAISAKGIVIFSTIDHSGEARKANMSLGDEKVIIFGDPKVGTFLMQENPLIGLELPLRILVWQAEKDLTHIAYIDRLSIGESYGISKNLEILRKMKDGLSLLIAEAIRETTH